MGLSPSIVMPSAVKKAIAAARSSTTTLTWSNLLIVMSPLYSRGPGGALERAAKEQERRVSLHIVSWYGRVGWESPQVGPLPEPAVLAGAKVPHAVPASPSL